MPGPLAQLPTRLDLAIGSAARHDCPALEALDPPELAAQHLSQHPLPPAKGYDVVLGRRQI